MTVVALGFAGAAASLYQLRQKERQIIATAVNFLQERSTVDATDCSQILRYLSRTEAIQILSHSITTAASLRQNGAHVRFEVDRIEWSGPHLSAIGSDSHRLYRLENDRYVWVTRRNLSSAP
jgi:hypothetical protein